MRIKKILLSLLICLLCWGSVPVTARAAATTPAEELRAAIDNLYKRYTLELYDAAFDLDQFTESMDFTGVRAWSCSGEQSRNKVTLVWKFEWQDDHAILAACKNPSLVNRLNTQQKTLLARCKQIITDIIKPDMTDYEKELAIHDYIVLHCEYDTATEATRNTSNVIPFSAYGALVNELAVCQGYTEAAAILLSMAGIKNYKLESDEHTWNLVNIGDSYYHLDITLDDPVGSAIDTVRYDFFNLTDRQIENYPRHDWHNRSQFPAADATEYQYFVYNGLFAENYTALKQLVTDAFDAGKPEITLWVNDCRTRAYDWDKDLQFIFNFKSNGRAVKSYSYIPPGLERDTLTVVFY